MTTIHYSDGTTSTISTVGRAGEVHPGPLGVSMSCEKTDFYPNVEEANKAVERLRAHVAELEGKLMEEHDISTQVQRQLDKVSAARQTLRAIADLLGEM